MNLLKINDTQLADLKQSLANETRRRTQMAVNGHDAATVIWGNELAKRALQIAAAGNHSILFVGPSNCGKTMLRAMALELGLDETYESRCCPCGNHSDPRSECTCTSKQIERTVAKYPLADITVELCRPLEREINSRGTSLADIRGYVSTMSKFTDESLEGHSVNLLRASINELGLDLVTVARIQAVARTIANLDHSEQIKPIHICEAINYRSFRRATY